jgi:hypothetical protein
VAKTATSNAIMATIRSTVRLFIFGSPCDVGIAVERRGFAAAGLAAIAH